jgi:hypothetical protein
MHDVSPALGAVGLPGLRNYHHIKY